MSYNKILIIQTAFPGDVVLTTPLIRAAKENFQHSEVYFLLIPDTQNLLKNNPHLKEVIVYDKKRKGGPGFWKTLNRVRRLKIDLALIPHRSFRSAFLAELANCKRRVGFNSSVGKIFLTDQVVYRLDRHEIERNLSLLSFFGIEQRPILPELFPGPQEFSGVEKLLSKNGASFSDEMVCIAPGSVWATKRWLPEGFARVAEKLIQEEKIKVILIGSAGDKVLADSIAGMMKKKPVNACGELSLLESAALISKARMVLSNDSAPTHMAVAMRTPVVTIFGSTVPEFGFYPYGEGNGIIQKQLYCRPCGIHGRNRCPEKHFRCMKEISAEEVFKTVQQKLNEKRVQTR
jgi:heptosyltransferase-2